MLRIPVDFRQKKLPEFLKMICLGNDSADVPRISDTADLNLSALLVEKGACMLQPLSLQISLNSILMVTMRGAAKPLGS